MIEVELFSVRFSEVFAVLLVAFVLFFGVGNGYVHVVVRKVVVAVRVFEVDLRHITIVVVAMMVMKWVILEVMVMVEVMVAEMEEVVAEMEVVVVVIDSINFLFFTFRKNQLIVMLICSR